MKQRFEASVTGRVQGVCFRYYTRQTAHGLGLSGWVRNEPDGSVRVLAEGERDGLDQLLGFLHRGPESASVQRVEVDWQDYQGDLSPFSVAR